MGNAMSEVRVLSLFTGAGGLDLGFHKSGFKTVACVEIDSPSCETLELNRGKYIHDDCKIFNNDITKLAPSSMGIENIDFIIGGPPCQSFSAAGRRAGGVTGINDTRGSLFWYYCNFIEYYKPKGFLFENVRGILQANNSSAWKIIIECFSSLGYRLFYRILDAADYGIAQHRERVILVGTREDNFLFPRPTHGPDSLGNKKHVTAREAFEGIDDPDEIVPPYGGKYGDLIPDIPPGMNYSFYTEKMGHPRPRFAWRSKFSAFLFKLDPDGLSKTIVAHQGRYDGPFHWKGRKLNLLELKRIQGFPDDYLFVNSKVEAMKQIGNSVSPAFSIVLAKAVMNQFFHNKFHDVQYIDEGAKLGFDRRKGRKSVKTREKSLANTKNKDQLSLLGDRNMEVVCECMKFTDFATYEISNLSVEFKRLFSLYDGKWDICLDKSEGMDNSLSIEILLSFDSLICNSFKEIRAVLRGNSVLDISKLWDAIHFAVSKSSSYESLQPLFGHFTEPYPRFKTKIKFYGANLPKLSAWIEKYSDYRRLGEMSELNMLLPYLDYGQKPIDIVKELRVNGFDIRVNETNRAIPVGYYKVCYPFTTFSIDKIYTTWKEKGFHKTGDVVISKNEKGYFPEHILR